MYCHACGTGLPEELSFCNRCGADLKKGDTATDSLLDGIFWSTVIGLGLIFGGVVALTKSGVREALVVAYMALGAAAFLGIYGMHVWQFINLTRRRNRPEVKIMASDLATGELEAAKTNALPEAPASIVENTTRSFEPVYRQKKR